MKYIQSFNEKFGIKSDLEEQAKKYFNEISSSDKNEFIFIYKNKKGNFPFTLKIGKVKKLDGQFKKDTSTKKLTILLSDRRDYSTFLHELKHLDYSIVKEFFYKDIFHVSNSKLKILKKNDPLIVAQSIFYLLDTNEFESRYHGYYVSFDKFISDYLHFNLLDNPTPSDIYNLFEKFLSQSPDTSWTWYVYDKEFRFENHLTESQINRLFHQFVFTKDFYKDEYDSIFTYIKSYIKKAFRSTFNNYNEEELTDIEKNKKLIENKINQRLPKYRKKFFRLVTLMVDKWCK